MKQIPLARLGLITPIIQFLGNIGSPIERHLNKSKIPLLALENPETLLPLPILLDFLGKTAKAESIENLGVVMGKSAVITETGMFGKLIAGSFNVYDVVKTVCRLSSNAISTSGEQFWLLEEEDHIWFCQKFIKSLHPNLGLDHGVYYSLALMLDCVRLALGDCWQPKDIYLASLPYKGLEESLGIGNTRLHYQKPFTAICIAKKLLSTPVNSYSSLRTNTLSSELMIKDWEKNAPALDFLGSLEQVIKTLLKEEYPTIDVTAEVSGFSVRTLQRQLSEHNTTYSRLMDKIRYKLALKLLNNPDVKLIDIAYTLGFKDPANFSHAFRRWTGISPSKFRQNSCF